MRLRKPIVRARLAALIVCSLTVTITPLSAIAEYGIPAGSGAVITAGQPLLVRAAPGWDAAVSYEIADGSYVTVWDVAQAASDGSLWYPVDGGFVPVDAVTSVTTLQSGSEFAFFQEQEADPVAEAWTEPVATEWTKPIAAETGWVDPATGEWVEPAATETGWVDPNTGQWVDSTTLAQEAPAEEWVEPTEIAPEPVAGEWTEPVAEVPLETTSVSEDWVEPVTNEPAPVDTSSSPDPAANDWTEPAPLAEVPAPADTEWVEPAPVETNSSGDGWGEPIGTAFIAGTNGDGAACRVSAERGSDKLAVLGEGEQVEVRGEAIGEWQPVNCAGMGGYVNTAFISWEPVAAAEGRRGRSRGNDGGDGASSNQIVDFAMQYVGYPYVYAGEGPYAFDCSGFTKFVFQNTLGMDITHDLFQQVEMGTPVDQDELQPGDMVFFANTFRPGLSHNGIYIGGGQFVHAENESTGVKVSDINSDYYSSRWYGAVRLS